MSILQFSQNMIRLRHMRKLTQEQLADFIGVTKASISKWETGQSLPDILMLPRLAAFFDVTIDELLGYEPQLSQEQIRRMYQELAGAFAERPFEEAMEQSKEQVKRYYSCYPFLFHVCNLWLNHFWLAGESARQMEILKEIKDLCGHILSGCRDIGICEDTVLLKAAVELQMGKTAEVMEALEELLNPCRLSKQSDMLLTQAYLQAGQKEKGEQFAQMSMFLHLMNLVAGATQYLALHGQDSTVCEKTISRVEQVIAAYHLELLHPNAAAMFFYQAAVCCCMQGREQEALELLGRYVAAVAYLLKEDDLSLHGDDYFDQLGGWYEQLDIGTQAPRDTRLIREDFRKSLDAPVFAVLQERAEYQRLREVCQRT